jgi:hypothetical protein
MALIRLIYVSAATQPFTQAGLRELLSKARTHNSAASITGLLLFHRESFFQILEGDEEVVAPLFVEIERDPRHHRVLMLSKTSIEERNFNDWSMGFIDVDRMATKLSGFTELLRAKSSFLDLRVSGQLKPAR